jgi:replicative DNA helicase
MGKSSCAVNMAENAAIRHGTPVAIFSLEMSKEQLAMRLLCSQSEVSLQKVRTGYLGNEDWPRLTTGAGLLTAAPILIDDSPSLSILELRAKCRRLKAEKKLGLVVVDYLQLMRSSTPAENRVQEISQISRGLKGLAKELEVPIIALSQLSRAVEQRGGHGRPQLSDLRESGCLTEDSRVLRADTGAEVTMGELLASGERDIPVWTVDDSYRVVRGTMSKVFPSGEKEVFEMRFTSGRSIKASANHPFLTLDGWRRLDQLRPGDRLAAPRRVPEPDDQAPVGTAYRGSTPSRERLMELSGVLRSAELHSLAESDLFWDEIRSIESIGVQPVFDATVPGTHNFIANGIVTHNSLEQDADVVVFVYREVVYKPDTAEPGKAQLIIAKQRNGPTDDVDMTFLRECTKFVPYSPVMSGETEPGF